MAGMYLLVTAPKGYLCTYSFPIDRADVGVGETVGQTWAVVKVSPPWQCDDVLQRDSDFGLRSLWLVGAKLEGSWIVELFSGLSPLPNSQIP
jgi:hypothetical protein